MKKLEYKWGIFGHNKVLDGIEKDLIGGNIAHAYLFSGAAGIGKYTVAKKFAYILQCPNGACGECNVCNEISRGYHSDTLEFLDNGSSIKIEEIRVALDRLNMKKQAARKILLIKNIERMTIQAANALLKTLEDPPEGTVFLLTTSNVKDIIPTIVSRVRTLKFRTLEDADMKDFILKMHGSVSEEMLNIVLAAAPGLPGRATSLLGNPALFDRQQKMLAEINGLLANPNVADRFLYVEGLVAMAKEEEDRQIIFDFMNVFELVLRHELLVNIRAERATLPKEQLMKLLELTQEARHLMKSNVNTRLLLENMMLAL